MAARARGLLTPPRLPPRAKKIAARTLPRTAKKARARPAGGVRAQEGARDAVRALQRRPPACGGPRGRLQADSLEEARERARALWAVASRDDAPARQTVCDSARESPPPDSF